MPYSAVLYYTKANNNAILYGTILLLYCTVLYYTILYYTILYYTTVARSSQPRSERWSGQEPRGVCSGARFPNDNDNNNNTHSYLLLT